MSKVERMRIRNLKMLIKKQSNSITTKNAEIKYLRLQISRIRNEMGKILDMPSSINEHRLTRQMRGLKNVRVKRVGRTLRTR